VIERLGRSAQGQRPGRTRSRYLHMFTSLSKIEWNVDCLPLASFEKSREISRVPASEAGITGVQLRPTTVTRIN
jgi:hypothetical protein